MMAHAMKRVDERIVIPGGRYGISVSASLRTGKAVQGETTRVVNHIRLRTGSLTLT